MSYTYEIPINYFYNDDLRVGYNTRSSNSENIYDQYKDLYLLYLETISKLKKANQKWRDCNNGWKESDSKCKKLESKNKALIEDKQKLEKAFKELENVSVELKEELKESKTKLDTVMWLVDELTDIDFEDDQEDIFEEIPPINTERLDTIIEIDEPNDVFEEVPVSTLQEPTPIPYQEEYELIDMDQYKIEPILTNEELLDNHMRNHNAQMSEESEKVSSFELNIEEEVEKLGQKVGEEIVMDWNF